MENNLKRVHSYDEKTAGERSKEPPIDWGFLPDQPKVPLGRRIGAGLKKLVSRETWTTGGLNG